MAVKCKRTCGLCGGDFIKLPIYLYEVYCAIFRVAETIAGCPLWWLFPAEFSVLRDRQETVDISYTSYFI